MRVAVTLFLLTCFILLGGYNAVQAAGHLERSCLSPKHFEKTQQVESQSPFCIVATGNDSGLEYSQLLAADEEDEEEELTTRKFIVLEKFFLQFFKAFLSGFSHDPAINLHSICRHLSYIDSHKYIAQRVLRI